MAQDFSSDPNFTRRTLNHSSPGRERRVHEVKVIPPGKPFNQLLSAFGKAQFQITHLFRGVRNHSIRFKFDRMQYCNHVTCFGRNKLFFWRYGFNFEYFVISNTLWEKNKEISGFYQKSIRTFTRTGTIFIEMSFSFTIKTSW